MTPPKTLAVPAVLSGFHPVREALRAGHPLDRVLLTRGAPGARIQEIVELCRQLSIPVRFESKEVLDRASRSENHQGIAAIGAAHRYLDLDDLDPSAGLLVVLDGVEDPHNLGAIVRTAHAAGAAAVVVPERRAVGLTETVAKAAAGALEYLPIVRVGNTAKTLELLKKRGYWIYGVDERGTLVYSEVDYLRPVALVFGGEGHGLHQNVKNHCDFLIRIPLTGSISSLNVSVATGIVLFEWRRRSALSAPSEG